MQETRDTNERDDRVRFDAMLRAMNAHPCISGHLGSFEERQISATIVNKETFVTDYDGFRIEMGEVREYVEEMADAMGYEVTYPDDETVVVNQERDEQMVLEENPFVGYWACDEDGVLHVIWETGDVTAEHINQIEAAGYEFSSMQSRGSNGGLTLYFEEVSE